MVHGVRSRRVVTPEGVRDAVVVIDGEVIAGIVAPGEVPEGMVVEDVGDAALLPGLVDAHAHINEPGRTEWEGFATATRAAAAGGFTTVVDMPLNSLPETTNVRALAVKRAAAEGKCLVDYALWGGCVDGNQDDLEPLAEAGVAGFKSFLIYPGCDGFTAIDRENLERALPHVKRTGLPLLVHAELEESIAAATARLNASGADWRRYATYLASRPDAAEMEAIAMLLDLCREYRFRLHIVHLSTAQALPMLRAARAEGLPVTVETCPHYLHFAAETIADGATLCKCAPPIRVAANRELLWEALRDGTIDLIATDHSPCPVAMKRLKTGRFDAAWGGITSLSTALSVVWTEAATRGFGLEEMARWMAAEPARLAGIAGQVGSIAVGRHANLVAFDTEAEFVVRAERLHTRHTSSAYLGERLRGEVQGTWLRGERVFTRSAAGDLFARGLRGREYLRAGVSAGGAEDMSEVLTRWNAMSAADAVAAILPCNGSATWAHGMAALRPFATAYDVTCSADMVWKALDAGDWQQAFDSHPRIGEAHAKAATAQSLEWSSGEQAGAALTVEVEVLLAAANREYEARFGRVFLVCATGKSAAEMLAILKARMGNNAATELREAAEQQRQITQIRLRKWLGEG